MTTSDIAPDYATDSLDAERALLGAALIAPYDIPALAELVQAADFRSHAHQWIWGALLDAGETADVVTVATRLEAAGKLAEAGGTAYLARLLGDTPSSANAEAYAALVAQAGRRRSLLAAASALAQSVARGDDPEQAAAAAIKALEGTAAGTAGLVASAAEAASEWYDRFVEYARTGEVPGLTTGFPLIDRKTLGLKRKELAILAARPSMGKTSLAAQMSVRQARTGLRVGVFTLEVSKGSWQEAAALAELGIDKTKASDADLHAVLRKCEEYSRLPMRFYERGYSSMGEIERAARQMERELGGLDVIVGDHLGYVDHLRGEKQTSLPYLIGQSTKRLAKLAKDYNAAVLWLCQLSRASAKEKAEPQLTDLRDSGEIEQDARMVLMLHRPGYYAEPEPPADKPQEARLLVRKNHEGPTGRIDLAFVKNIRRFAEYDGRPH